MKYFIFDLEPYEERYTKQMREWVHHVFKSRKKEFEFVSPVSITERVETGFVLDAVGTTYYKAAQLMFFSVMLKDHKIRNDDIIFIFDIQFPIEWLRYSLDLSGLSGVKIYAVCHAGSYVNGDFTQSLGLWFKLCEAAWFRICDGIFVGSEYHKNKLLQNIEVDENKVHMTGNVFSVSDVRSYVGEIKDPKDRNNDIIFSNRWDAEKDPGSFITLVELLLSGYGMIFKKPLNIVITTSREKLKNGTDKIAYSRLMVLENCLDEIIGQWGAAHQLIIKEGITKKEYYETMADTKVFVTTSPEEMFGYCTAEAMALGCHPIAPNIASHPELLRHDGAYLYNSMEEAVDLIQDAIQDPKPCVQHAKFFDESIDKMIDVMEGEDGGSPWL